MSSLLRLLLGTQYKRFNLPYKRRVGNGLGNGDGGDGGDGSEERGEERGRNKPKSMEAVSKRRVFVDISRARDPRNSVSHQRRLSPFVAVPCLVLPQSRSPLECLRSAPDGISADHSRVTPEFLWSGRQGPRLPATCYRWQVSWCDGVCRWKAVGKH